MFDCEKKTKRWLNCYEIDGVDKVVVAVDVDDDDGAVVVVVDDDDDCLLLAATAVLPPLAEA